VQALDGLTLSPVTSPLHRCIRIARAPWRPRTGFFLRAESFFDLVTEFERLDAEPPSTRP